MIGNRDDQSINPQISGNVMQLDAVLTSVRRSLDQTEAEGKPFPKLNVT